MTYGQIDDAHHRVESMHRAQFPDEYHPDIVREILVKLDEEVAELRDAIKSGDHTATRDELGDVWFVWSALAARLGFHSAELIQEQVIDKNLRRWVLK